MGAVVHWVEEDGSARLVDQRGGEAVAGDWLARGVFDLKRVLKGVRRWGGVGWSGGRGCGNSWPLMARSQPFSLKMMHRSRIFLIWHVDFFIY